jgi:hypothetical protein
MKHFNHPSSLPAKRQASISIARVSVDTAAYAMGAMGLLVHRRAADPSLI